MPPDAERRLPAWWWIAAIAILAIGLLWLVVRYCCPELDRELLIRTGERIPGGLFAVLFVVLPPLGVPISWFLVLAGLKFGVGWGMLLATGAIAVHNLAAFAATKSWLQQPIERMLGKLGYSIPSIPDRHQWWFTMLFTGVPSLPYAVKLYSLALTNISFRIYFWVGWPTYAASCIVFVGLGDAAARLSLGWFTAVALVSLVVLWTARRYLRGRGPRAASHS